MRIENLNFDKNSKNFETEFHLSDEKYFLTLCDFKENEIEKATQFAGKIVKWLNININKVKPYAASEMLEIKNDTWLEEDQDPITTSEFVEGISMEGVTAFSDGSFETYFNDGDIFWGHSIVVGIDEEFNFTNADISG